ncbi:iron ABC transporter permease [Pseudomonas syringae]|nr:iron ABC transporter permease [Pseudomonas syringae]MBD8791449.1 iron ABC transporter permease [Pseudomonas syringae]MBD8801417.1 iron ABC transporter permease [Pseudomonas syringae]MBD8810306.1 iron ABC transporter permease [Pseudomonas syringae]
MALPLNDASTLYLAYRRILRRRLAVCLVLALLVIGSLIADIALGVSSFSVTQVLQALFWPQALDPDTRVIIQELRLPFALMAVLVGVALSLAGAEMQTILNNPLASPFTLGVSSAASLGAALAIVLQVGIPGVPDTWLVTGNAFVFAFASVLLLQAVASFTGGVQTLVLFGIALVFSFNALVAMLQYVASADALQQLVFWSMGSLNRASWEAVQTLGLVVLLVVPFSLRAAWPMTTLRLGDERAATLGIDVNRLRFFALLRISLLAATAVAFVGTIGFIGLVGPHIARMLIGEDHRFFLPVSALMGALVMSLSAIASKLLIPGVILPVGIVTALVGVPLFMSLIFKRGRA